MLFKAAPTENKDKLKIAREQVADERDALVAKMGGAGLTPELDRDEIIEKIRRLEFRHNQLRKALGTTADDNKPSMREAMREAEAESDALNKQLREL